MLKEIGSYDAKTKLPEILRKVQRGESFTITNRGKPIADLIPSRSSNHLKTLTSIESILKNKGVAVSDEELADMKGYGRK